VTHAAATEFGFFRREPLSHSVKSVHRHEVLGAKGCRR